MCKNVEVKVSNRDAEKQCGTLSTLLHSPGKGRLSENLPYIGTMKRKSDNSYKSILAMSGAEGTQ